MKSSGVLEHLVVTKCQSLFSHGLPLYIGILILKLVNKQTHTHTKQDPLQNKKSSYQQISFLKTL